MLAKKNIQRNILKFILYKNAVLMKLKTQRKIHKHFSDEFIYSDYTVC